MRSRAARNAMSMVDALALATLLSACAPSGPPNLVVVTLDTVRCDHLGAFGGDREDSPHLDALAARGLVHERAFTTMPTTGPAHASLFTGLYPSEHGSLENGDPVDGSGAAASVVARLQARGYATAGFVTTVLLSQAATGLGGFDVYEAPRQAFRPGIHAVDEALAWLAAERRRPVFLWVHLYDAHAPYGDAQEKLRSGPVDPRRYGWVDRQLYAPPEARERMARLYRDGVRSGDAALGRLLRGVETELGRNLLVVVAGDHGEALDEHLAERGYAYDHGEFLDAASVCIPLVVAGRGVTPGRSTAVASIRDVAGTLLVAAGLGDPGASFDLREPSRERRTVVVERRRLPPPGLSPDHAVAIFGDAASVWVASDGEPGDGRGPATAELVQSARQHLAALEARSQAPSIPPYPSLEEALRSLGYVE